jgi:hypothetical protein
LFRCYLNQDLLAFGTGYLPIPGIIPDLLVLVAVVLTENTPSLKVTCRLSIAVYNRNLNIAVIGKFWEPEQMSKSNFYVITLCNIFGACGYVSMLVEARSVLDRASLSRVRRITAPVLRRWMLSDRRAPRC